MEEHNHALNTSKTATDEPPWEKIVERAVHDMRTPLSCMRTSLELLRMLPAGSEKHAKVLGILNAQLDLLGGQMEALLARPESFLFSEKPGRPEE